jgi:hypothetical protein
MQELQTHPRRKGFGGIRAENMIVEVATSLTGILETRDLESKQLKNRR